MNHLFIGLGGTGGNVIKSFRKLYYQQFGDKEVDGIGIDYLWVDSSPNSFKAKQPDWDFLGKSLSLKPRNQFYIAKADLKSIIDNLNSYPNLKPWLGDRAAWGEVLNGLSPEAAGGQKRRLGRFLLAMHIDELNAKINTLVRGLQDQTGSSDITFHVMCGLAGGTGSGTIVDVLAQLRKNYPHVADGSSIRRIIAYTYLPDANPPAGWNTGNYHANAYAALLELNAMSAGRWRPFDIASGKGPIQDLDFIFNGCYVFTDNNSKGYTVSINNNLTDILADFIYNKVVISRNINWQGLARAENAENGNSSPETEYGEPARSVRFMSFGISRLEFPEERLHASLSYEYQLQALEQLRFNNWQEGHGFINRQKPFASTEYINNNKVQDDWRITDAHLRLEKPIIDTKESNKWKAHDITWMELCNHYINIAKQTDKSQWLNEIYRLLNHCFNEQYRGKHGVKEFFSYADRDLKDYATHIKNLIQNDLINNWRTGERSLAECSEILTALKQEFDNKVIKISDNIEKKALLADKYNEQYKTLEVEWAKLRLGSIVTKSRDKDLNRAAGYLREYFCALTYIEAYEYQKDLINELVVQLIELQTDIDTSNSVILNATEESKSAINVRKATEDNDNSNQYIETLEDAALQDKVRRKLVLDKEIQDQQTSMVRQHIFEMLGSAPTFSRFIEKQDDIKKKLLQYSFESVKVAHDKHITQENEKILGVSIIDKLYDKYGNDETKLNEKAHKLINEASDFATISNTQLNKDFSGRIANAKENRALNTTGVLIPMPEGHEQFIGNIKEAFKQNFHGKNIDFIKSEENNNAISVLSVTNLMPLRFIQIVSVLQKKYEERIAHHPARAQLEIHIEGDGSQLPSLFIMDEGAVKELLRPMLLLALSTEMLTEKENPATNKTHIVQLKKDEFGFDLDPIVYGTDILDIVDNITDKQMMELKQDTIQVIEPNLPYNQNEVEVFIKKVHNLLAQIRQHINTQTPKQAEALMSEWNNAARQTIKIIRGDEKL